MAYFIFEDTGAYNDGLVPWESLIVEHGPFSTIEEASHYWRDYNGVYPGEEWSKWSTSPKLVERNDPSDEF